MGALDEGFLRRTYRSTALLTGVALLYLWAYQWNWAMLPVVAGAAVGLAMLWANDAGLRSALAPLITGAEGDGHKNPGHGGVVTRALAWVALVKYLLAALLLWALVRWWSLNELAAFAFGVSLIPTNIAMRVLSRCLAASTAGPEPGKRRTRAYTTYTTVRDRPSPSAGRENGPLAEKVEI